MRCRKVEAELSNHLRQLHTALSITAVGVVGVGEVLTTMLEYLDFPSIASHFVEYSTGDHPGPYDQGNQDPFYRIRARSLNLA